MIKNKLKVGLALSSGGARGLAHIGVIKAFVANNIPIDFIAGTSAGAIIGGFYSAWQDINKIEDLALTLKYRDLLRVFGDLDFKAGLFGGKNILRFVKNYLGNIDIENLPIKFCAVATDIITGDKIVLNTGNLAESVVASGSVPGIFKPVEINGHHLIDGGASEPVPVETVRSMGADIVIAVNLDDMLFPKKHNGHRAPAMAITLRNTVQLLRYHLAQENIKNADVVICPDVPYAKINRFVNGHELIRIGEEATIKLIPQLKKLIR